MSEKISVTGGDGVERLVSPSPILEGIEELYGGKFVALRNREVVIVADTEEEIFNSPDYIQGTDLVYPVPEPDVTYYYRAA